MKCWSFFSIDFYFYVTFYKYLQYNVLNESHLDRLTVCSIAREEVAWIRDCAIFPKERLSSSIPVAQLHLHQLHQCAVTLAHLQSTSFATCHLQILWMCDWILSCKRKDGASKSITLGISSWAVWQVCPQHSLSLFSVRGWKHQNLISRLNF